MKARYVLSFLAFGVMIGYAIYYIGALGVRIGPPDHRINISMQVPDINGLVVDSNVMLRGVPVGKVTAINTSVDNASIDFYVAGEHQIPVDSEVKLENLSALGETYIGLVPRTAEGPMFQDGQAVDTEDITNPASISQLSTSVVRMLNQLDPGQLQRLVDELDVGLPDETAVLPNLSRAAVLLRGAVTSMDGRGAQVLTNLQTLLENAGWVGPALSEIAPPLRELGEPLRLTFLHANRELVKGGGIEGLRNFGRLVARVQGFLDNRASDLQIFGEAFAPNINAVAAAAMNMDTGRMLTNILDAYPEDGTVTLRVRTPAP